MITSHLARRSKSLLGHSFRAFSLLAFLTSAAAAQAQPTLADFGHKNMETKGERPLLVILLEDPALPKLVHDAKYFDKLFFGSDPQTVNRYFTAMSGGRFKWSKVDVIGPFKVKVLKIPHAFKT